VAYVDWSQQEFGIAAALSDDMAMMEAYRSGDPYLTLQNKPGQRRPMQRRKRTRLSGSNSKSAPGVQYGMEAESLADRLGSTPAHADELLRLHRQTYPAFWRWSQSAVDRAALERELWSVFGWRLHFEPRWNWRTASNFPVQANGAEMLRLACCLATERGIMVCAPVHDALLVEGPAESIDAVVVATQAAMLRQAGLCWETSSCGRTPRLFAIPTATWTHGGENVAIVTGLLAEAEPAPL